MNLWLCAPFAALQSVQILKIYISQGSVVMRIRCGGIFNDYFVTGFPQSVAYQWKNFENRSIFGELTTNSVVYCFDSQCNSKVRVYYMAYMHMWCAVAPVLKTAMHRVVVLPCRALYNSSLVSMFHELRSLVAAVPRPRSDEHTDGHTDGGIDS